MNPSPPVPLRHAGEGFELTGPVTPVRELLREVWRSRALLLVLARKDFLVRYRRTVLGVGWAIGLPLVQAVVLTIVFGHIVHANRLTEPGTSYPVFLYAGLVPWTFVAATLPAASTAIVDNLGLVTKIYFPRVLTVLLTTLGGLVPLLAGTAILLALDTLEGPPLGVELLWLVPGALLSLLLVLAFGAVLSAAHVYVRDLRFVVQAVMTVGFYVTPVLYPLDAAPGALRGWVALLPAAGPVELFRMATVGADDGAGLAILASVVWCVVVGAAGLVLQSRRDRVFVDLL